MASIGTMRAVVLQEDRKAKVEQRPIPVLGPKEILCAFSLQR
jgi:hypothetical protein